MWLYQKLVKTCTNWIGNFCRFVHFSIYSVGAPSGRPTQTSFGSCEPSVLSLSGGPTSVPLLTLSASARSFSNGIIRSDGTPCARPLLPSSDRSAGQRNQTSHDTVLARPVCPFVCVSAASFPCRFLDLGLTFILASAYCTRARQSFPAVYVGVVECASTSPYTYSSSTHRFPDERTPIEAMPLSATSTELVRVGVWVWDWIHSHTPPRTRSPSSRHPLFTHYPFPPRSLVCGGQASPHKPRLVVSHSTCPPLSSSPHAHSFVIGPAVINTHTRGSHLQ